MTYAKFDVNKPSNSAGRGSDIKGIATLFEWDDVLNGFQRDADGITITGNILFKAGAFMQKLYFTKSTLKNTSKSDGDDDKRGIVQACEFQHPGNSADIRKLRNYYLNKNIGIIYEHCNSDQEPDLYGSPCNPLQMNFEFEESKDSIHTQFNFESVAKGDDVAIYLGTNTYNAVELVAADTAIIDVASGEGIYQLSDNTVPTELTGFSNETDAMLVTLWGSGGTNPANINSGGNFVLKNGASWSGITDATITFRVFADGASSFTYIEQSRT